MDSQTNVQKRNRTDSTEDTIAIQVPGESLNSDDYRYGLPSIEDKSNTYLARKID
jgi:hypothetical protein